MKNSNIQNQFAGGKADTGRDSRVNEHVQLSKGDYWIVSVIIAIAVLVILVPGLVFAPVQKAILYFLVSLMGAILMGRVADATFTFRKGGAFLKIMGVWVVIFSAILLLDYITKPEVRVVVFDFYYKGDKVQVTTEDSFKLKGGGAGAILPVVHRVNNHIILQFPEQVYEVMAEIRIPTGENFSGTLTYEPAQSRVIDLGGDDSRFKKIQTK